MSYLPADPAAKPPSTPPDRCASPPVWLRLLPKQRYTTVHALLLRCLCVEGCRPSNHFRSYHLGSEGGCRFHNGWLDLFQVHSDEVWMGLCQQMQLVQHHGRDKIFSGRVSPLHSDCANSLCSTSSAIVGAVRSRRRQQELIVAPLASQLRQSGPRQTMQNCLSIAGSRMFTQGAALARVVACTGSCSLMRELVNRPRCVFDPSRAVWMRPRRTATRPHRTTSTMKPVARHWGAAELNPARYGLLARLRQPERHGTEPYFSIGSALDRAPASFMAKPTEKQEVAVGRARSYHHSLNWRCTSSPS